MHAIYRSVSFVVLIFAIVVRRHRLQRRSSSRAVCRCSSPQTSLVVVLRPDVPLSNSFFLTPPRCLVGRSPSPLLLSSRRGRPSTLAAMAKRRANRRDADLPCIAGHRGAAAMAAANGGTASAALQEMARE